MPIVNDLDLPQNVIGSSLVDINSLQCVRYISVQCSFSYPADNQTNTGENVTLKEVIIHQVQQQTEQSAEIALVELSEHNTLTEHWEAADAYIDRT